MRRVLDKTVNFLAYMLTMVSFNRDRLAAFANRALSANVTYFAVRRELLDLFTSALDQNGDINLASREFITIKTFLTSRDSRPSDNARLAYEVAIMSILELVEGD